MQRRFTPPWTATTTPSGYCVTDANGVAMAYVYGEDQRQGANDIRLTADEARRVATAIARLPELLIKPKR
jgi:hypothetical protein